MQDKPILVIGATGKTGRRVASRLEARGVAVRRGARNSVTPFDWDAPETWAPALRGARAAYVTYFPDLAFPGAVEKLESLCETARDVEVEHLVLLSGRGEHHARLGEDVVRGSGVDFTIVRAAWFAQNFSEGYLRDPILAGVLPMPGGDVVERLERDARFNVALGFLLPFLTPAVIKAASGVFGSVAITNDQTMIWTITAWAFLPASLFMRGIAMQRVATLISEQRARNSSRAEGERLAPA